MNGSYSGSLALIWPIYVNDNSPVQDYPKAAGRDDLIDSSLGAQLTHNAPRAAIENLILALHSLVTLAAFSVRCNTGMAYPRYSAFPETRSTCPPGG